MTAADEDCVYEATLSRCTGLMSTSLCGCIFARVCFFARVHPFGSDVLPVDTFKRFTNHLSQLVTMHSFSMPGSVLQPAAPVGRLVTSRRTRIVPHAGPQNWAGRKAEQADHKVHQAIEAVPTPPKPHTCVLLCRYHRRDAAVLRLTIRCCGDAWVTAIFLKTLLRCNAPFLQLFGIDSDWGHVPPWASTQGW